MVQSRRRASTARNRGSTKKAKREANCRLTVGKQPSLRTTTTRLGVSTDSKSRAGGGGDGARLDRTGARESMLTVDKGRKTRRGQRNKSRRSGEKERVEGGRAAITEVGGNSRHLDNRFKCSSIL